MLGPLSERLQLSMRALCGSRRSQPMSINRRWFVQRGVLLALPIFIAGDVSGLIRQGCQIFAAEVAGGRTVPIDEIHQVPPKLILAVGNESRGVSAHLRKQAITRFTIPLSRDVESLNVAAVVAIATFYLSRLPKEK